MNDLIQEPQKQEVTVQEQPQLPATPEQQMLNAVMKAASDPNCDVDKMEKLLAMNERMMDKQAKMDYDEALSRVQADMPRINERGEIKNKHGTVTARYMKYEDIDREIRPRLQAEGFSLMHTRVDENNKMVVTTILKHKNGHEESVCMPLPYDQQNAMKNAVQAAVSTFSYGKRVNVCSLLNIVAEGEDDNGATSNANKISDAQATEIKQWLEKLFNEGKNVDTAKFLAYIGADCVENIPASRYEVAIELLKRKDKETV